MTPFVKNAIASDYLLLVLFMRPISLDAIAPLSRWPLASSEIDLINKPKSNKSLAIKHGASVVKHFFHSKPSVRMTTY